jgi:hypothetical protein
MGAHWEASPSDARFSEASVLALGTERSELDVGRRPRHIEYNK